MRALGALVATLLILAGCGNGGESAGGADSASDDSDGAVAYPEDQYDESEVIEHLGLVEGSGAYFFRAAGLECEIAVVLTDAEMVSLYADAGDVVASNPDATAGVKITSADSQECYTAITDAFADLA